MIATVWKFLARLLVLDCPTVCAINGHASAGWLEPHACLWTRMYCAF